MEPIELTDAEIDAVAVEAARCPHHLAAANRLA
jgi:hypothetical protein